TAILHVGGVSSDPAFFGSDSHTPTRQPTHKCTVGSNKNFPTHQIQLMNKRVILITGTPGTGKTTTAKALAAKLDAQYINLTDYAKTNQLTQGEDKQRKTIIIDE